MPDLIPSPRPDGPDLQGESEKFYLDAAVSRWGSPPPPTGSEITEDLTPFLRDCYLEAKPTPTGPQYTDPDLQDPRITQVRDLFDTWPAAREGFGRFVTRFWPLDVPGRAPGVRGSVSGHEITEDGNRCAYVTICDPFGCYEGLLHEWAHLRLHALGVGLEEHDGRYLDHPVDEMFVSPIRKDKLRPMSAVLHGVLAWCFLTAGDLRMVNALEGKVNVEAVLFPTIVWNVPKLEEGRLTLSREARWTKEGEGFGGQLLAWLDELIEHGWDAVGRGRRDAALEANRKWVEGTGVPESPLHHGGTA